MKSFEELGLCDEILRAVSELGFVNPMPVQETAIPLLLQNRGDVVALAQTGTGKTAAYGLPLIQQTDVSRREAQALILSPTRELCVQIAGDLADFSKYIDGLHIIPMYGGTSIENQIRNFKRGAHIIVATPGRLLDLMNRGVVHLDKIRTLILDEADEMLNMGFSEDLEAIISQVPEGRQTMMFSATMSNEIAGIAKKYLRDAKEIVIGTRNEGAENVNHIYHMVHAKDKYLALKRVVDYYPNIYAIVFCRTRMETQEVADKLIQDGYNADSLHGELSQAQRDLTMQKFRKRQLQLLVATDVAARGLDVDDLTHVINYGLPDDTENYTHRSGRTGRAGKTGTSVSIINLRERGKIRQIEKAIGKQFQYSALPSGDKICEKQLYKVMDDLESFQVDEQQIAPFLSDIMRKLDWLDREDIIKRVVGREFLRFAEYYSNAPEIDEVSPAAAADNGNLKDKKEKRKIARDGFSRIFINVGKLDGIKPTGIMELINRKISGPRIDIGRIDLMHSYSFFEVPAEFADEIIEVLNGCVYKHRELHVEMASGQSDAENVRTEKRVTAGKDRHSERTSFRKTRSERNSSGHNVSSAGVRRHDGNNDGSEKMSGKTGAKKKHPQPSRAPRISSGNNGCMNENNTDDFLDGDWRQFFRNDDNKKKKSRKP